VCPFSCTLQDNPQSQNSVNTIIGIADPNNAMVRLYTGNK